MSSLLVTGLRMKIQPLVALLMEILLESQRMGSLLTKVPLVKTLLV